ncbi:7366_t:CDS:2 [Scutellospora calospora]|uniref:7366_t:CDS:1 n=1 Tax=Scutellospora calospora TaxID=85575 RepID=A0ACA9JTV8_9GLOM|nr:7366_t:CDS:2 [Scutellospora calospora]
MAEDLDIDKYLATEATQLQKDQEVERILSAFKLNPFDVLDLASDCTEKDIKNAYRKKSLLIHPDKTKHPKAQEAFSLLKKAETELSNEKSRQLLLTIIEEAKITLINEQKLKSTDPFINTKEFKLQIKQKTKDILIEQELRRRKLLKRELEAQETREQRVNNWRDFQTKKTSSSHGGTKKKKKFNSEFKPPKVLAEDPSKPYIKRPTNS